MEPEDGDVIMTSANRTWGVTVEPGSWEGERLGVFLAPTKTELSWPTQTSRAVGRQISPEGGFFTGAVPM